MKKRLISVLLMFLIVLSTLAYANDSSDNCSGFWGSMKCFLWGDSSARAGRSWWARGNVVGKAGTSFPAYKCVVDDKNPKICKVIDFGGTIKGYALTSETSKTTQTLYTKEGTPQGSCNEGVCQVTGFDPAKLALKIPPSGSTYEVFSGISSTPVSSQKVGTEGAKTLAEEGTSVKQVVITPQGEVYQHNEFGTWSAMPPSGEVITTTKSGGGTKSFLVGQDSKAVEVKVTPTESYKVQGTNKPVYQSTSGIWLNPDGTVFSGKVEEKKAMEVGNVYQVDSQGKTEAILVPVTKVPGESTVYVKVGAGEKIQDKVTYVDGKPAGNFVDANENPMLLTSKGYALTKEQVAAVGKKLIEQGIVKGVDAITEPDNINGQYLAALEQQGTFEADSKGGLGFKVKQGEAVPVLGEYSVVEVEPQSGPSQPKEVAEVTEIPKAEVAGGETMQPSQGAGVTLELPGPGSAEFGTMLTPMSGEEVGIEVAGVGPLPMGVKSLLKEVHPSDQQKVGEQIKKQLDKGNTLVGCNAYSCTFATAKKETVSVPYSFKGVTYQGQSGETVVFKDGKFYTTEGTPYTGAGVVSSNGVKYDSKNGEVVATYHPISPENLKSTAPVYLKVGAGENIQDLVSLSKTGVPQGDHFVDSSGNKLYVTSKGAVVTEQQMLATQKALEARGVDLGLVATVGAEDKEAFNQKLLAAMETQGGEFESTPEGLVFKPFEGETAFKLEEQTAKLGLMEPGSSQLSSQSKKKKLVVTEIPKSEVAKKGSVFSTAEEEAKVKAAQAKIATETATKLFEAGVDSWGTDEEAIFKALAGKSLEEIELIKAKYKELTKGNDLDADMQSELSDDEYAQYVGLTETAVAESEKAIQQEIAEAAEMDVLVAEAEKAAAIAGEVPKPGGQPHLAEGEVGSGKAEPEPSEYLEVKIEAGEGEVISAVGAVQQASPKALQNPEQYEVTFNGEPAVPITVEENGVTKQVYYSSVDIDEDGFPKYGSKPVAINPETVLMVHKKPEYQEVAGATPKKSIEQAPAKAVAGAPEQVDVLVASGLGTVVDTTPFEVIETKQLLDDLKSGADGGQYYEDNPALINQLHEQGLLTDEQYEDLNGDGWFNAQGTLADAQKMVEENVKLVQSEKGKPGKTTSSDMQTAVALAELAQITEEEQVMAQAAAVQPATPAQAPAAAPLTPEQQQQADAWTSEIGALYEQQRIATLQGLEENARELGDQIFELAIKRSSLYEPEKYSPVTKVGQKFMLKVGGEAVEIAEMNDLNVKDSEGNIYYYIEGKWQIYEYTNGKWQKKAIGTPAKAAAPPAAPEPVASEQAFGSSTPFTQKAIAKQVAYELQDAGVGQLGTDEDKIYKLLEDKSPAEIKLIKEQYKQLTGNDLETDMKDELDSDEYAQVSGKLTVPEQMVAAQEPTATQPTAPSAQVAAAGTQIRVVSALSPEVAETKVLLDNLKSGAAEGKYYEDDSATIDKLHEQGLLTDEQYEELNGDGVFNVQGTLADAQKMVEENVKLVQSEKGKPGKTTSSDMQTAVALAELAQITEEEQVMAQAAAVQPATPAQAPAAAPLTPEKQQEVTDATANLKELFDNTGGLSSVGKDEFDKALGGADLAQVKAEYKKQYGKDLDKVAEDEMSDTALAAYQSKVKEAEKALAQAPTVPIPVVQGPVAAEPKPAAAKPAQPAAVVSTPLTLPEGKKVLTDNDPQLQAALTALGYDIKGSKDPDLVIRFFQKENNLNEDGAAGKDTLAVLNHLLQQQQQAAQSGTANLPTGTALEPNTKIVVGGIGYMVAADGKSLTDGLGNTWEVSESQLVKKETAPPAQVAAGTIAKAPATQPTIITPPKLSTSKQASATKYNGGSSQFSALSTKIKSDESFKAQLTDAGIDAQKVANGDVAEIQKLQQLVGANPDGKWGGNSETALNSEAGQQKLVAAAKGVKIPVAQVSGAPPAAASPAAPKPPPEKTLKEKLEEIRQQLAGGKLTHNEAEEQLEALVKQAKKLTEASAGKLEAAKSANAKTYADLKTIQSAPAEFATAISKLPEKTQIKYDGKTLTKNAAGKWVDEKGQEVTVDKSEKLEDLKTLELQAAEGEHKDNKQGEKDVEKAEETNSAQTTYLLDLEKLQNNPTYAAIKEYGSKFGDIATFMSKLGSYSALSNLIWGAEAQNWLINANNEFLNTWSDLPGYFARSDLICDYDSKQRASKPGQSSVFIHQPGGVFQFVGSIQAEKSPVLSSILCERNTQENATEEWLCSPGQVCVNNYCYKGEDPEAIDPDTDKPAQGYFYKLTWTVTAPSDKSFTPYFDEDGVSVKFNLQLSPGGKWIYKQLGSEPLEVWNLENGASQSAVIVKYLPENYNSACIKFHPDYRIIDSEGDGVGEICADFISTSKGLVEYSSSDQSGSAYTSTSGSSSAQVVMDI